MRPALGKEGLTLSQMTGFTLFQTQRVCRRQFRTSRKWQKILERGRKHGGKRRNCSLRVISPFPSVFKRFVLQIRKKHGLFGKGLSKLPKKFLLRLIH